jgi:hypothetical protein
MKRHLDLLRNEGIDTSYADSFIGDVLSRRELQSAFTFHRLSPEQQISELLGIIDDPADESQIQVLFAKDNVPSDLLEYYRNKRSQKSIWLIWQLISNLRTRGSAAGVLCLNKRKNRDTLAICIFTLLHSFRNLRGVYKRLDPWACPED